MPIHSLKIPFAQMRGTIRDGNPRTGLSVTDAPTAAHNSRRYNPHQPPCTPAQRKIRTYTAASAKAWSALPAATAAAWRSLAGQITRDNSLGYTYRLAGIGVWNQVQVYRQLDGLAIDATVPDPLDVPGPVTTITNFYVGAGNLIIIAYYTGLPDTCKALLRITNSSPNQARMRQHHELRIPTTNTTQSIVLANAWRFIWNLLPTAVSLTNLEWVGFELIYMSPAYLPRAPQFFPLRQLYSP
jgi:hypothetical protein